MINSQSFTLNPENVAYWFFRINGCCTISNFVVHPDLRGSQRTDVDILAVRFPYRSELLTSGNPMPDHPVFNSSGKIEIIFAEVKNSLCSLNGPWTNPPSENMQRVLYAVGAFDPSQVPEVAEALYQNGFFQNDFYRVRLFAIGDRRNPAIFPFVEQLLWDEILNFIFIRLTSYQAQKAQHGQWDDSGIWLYKLASRCNREDFIVKVRTSMQEHIDTQNISRQNQEMGNRD